VAVNVFLTSTTVVLKHFAEGSQVQTYEFLESRTKKIYHKTIDTFFLIVLTMSVTPNFRCYWKTLPIERNPFLQQRFRQISYRVYISPTK